MKQAIILENPDGYPVDVLYVGFDDEVSKLLDFWEQLVFKKYENFTEEDLFKLSYILCLDDDEYKKYLSEEYTLSCLDVRSVDL